MRILTIVLLLLSFSLRAEQAPTALLQAPDWQLYNEQGELIQSSDFAGKPLIIHFWATWCPYCKKLQPGLNKLYQKYHSQGLQMIAISFKEDPGATPQAVLDARGMSFKTVVEGDKVAREAFAVLGTPTTFFINARGQIIFRTMLSDPDDPRLEKAVQYLIKQN